MKRVISYKTFDNMVFETQEEAKKHEDKILEALETIANLCEGQNICNDCPFFEHNGWAAACKLHQAPRSWKVKEIMEENVCD